MQRVIISEINSFNTDLEEAKINVMLDDGWTVSNITMQRSNNNAVMCVFVLAKEEDNNKKKIL
jgi:hypothetical protein